MSLLLNIIPFFGFVVWVWFAAIWREKKSFEMRVDGTNFTGCSSLLFSFLEKNQCHSIRLHISLFLSVFWDLQKKVQFLKILILILIRKEFHFFLSTLFPNFYRCFKIRFYGTLLPFSSHCDIFYSVCHLTIQH